MSLTASSSSSSSSNSSSSSSSSIYVSSSDQSTNIDLTGDIINQYNVIVELGRGSYSIVWLVYCMKDNNFYAMKVQNPEDYSEGLEEVNIMKKISNKDIYLNYLIQTFIETRFNANEEIKLVCSVYNLCGGNLDGFARKGNYKKGYPIHVVKKILKQICLGLQTIHTKLNGFHGDIKPDNILLCGINNRDLQYIKLYQKADFPTTYQTVKNEYMKEKKIKKISTENKLRIRKKLHQQIIESMPDEIKENKYSINDKYILNPSIKITDFGFFCHNDEKFNESFGTEYYKSPENILHGKCNEKVDIWALGCMLYELVTGNILFDPDEDERGSITFNHLEMIINLCNEFTPSFILNTKLGREYFNKNGKLINIKYSDNFNNSSLSKLSYKINLHSGIVDPELVDLLIKLLNLNPIKRLSITEILNHKWLHG